MMNKIDEFLEKGLGDWSVVAFRWIDDHDFAMEMLPPGSTQTVLVKFLWVRDMNIDFQFGIYSGMPLVYELNYRRGSAGIDIEVVFGGQPDGRISFQCDDMLITTPPPPATQP